MQRATPIRILLVEDDDTARLSLSRVLSRAGYKVDDVPNGEQAVALLAAPDHTDHYDVVLTDLLLHEVDGIQVLRQARELPNPPEVVLLTGYGTLQTAIESLRLGAFDYLLKPCKVEDLLRCVEGAAKRRQARANQSAAMRLIAEGLADLQQEGTQASTSPTAAPEPEPEPPTRTPLQLGNLLLDVRIRAAYYAGRALALTPTEYDLLQCLAEAQGGMLTYAEIARRVYRQAVDEAAAHQLIKTHIHNLRRKVGPQLIVNVRSTGYRLIDG